jgi:hypothetical protein
MSRIPICLHNGLIDSGEVVIIMRPPRYTRQTHFLSLVLNSVTGSDDPGGPERLEGICTWKQCVGRFLGGGAVPPPAGPSNKHKYDYQLLAQHAINNVKARISAILRACRLS